MATYGTSNPRYKHGKSTTPEYKIWVDMRQRCENPNRTNFKHYGGRGIVVCERWRSFDAFLQDMRERPTTKHSIERRDNDGPYSPDNCFWATTDVQHRNNRRNRWIDIDGRTQTIGDWAREFGLDERLIRLRIKRGCSERDAVMTPIQPNIGGRRRYNRQLPTFAYAGGGNENTILEAREIPHD